MTADAPGEEPPSSDGDDPDWLRRLFEFETGRRSPGGAGAADGGAGDRPAPDRHGGDGPVADPREGDSTVDVAPDHRRYRDARARRPSSHFPPGVDPAASPPGTGETPWREPPSPHSSGGTPADGAGHDSPLLRAVRREADFDRIRLSGSPADHAYGRTVRATVDDGTDRGSVCLRLFRRPDADETGLESALATQLARWAAASGVDGVVPVLESAADPRPWACTAPLGPTMREFEPLLAASPLAQKEVSPRSTSQRSLVRALRDARDLTHALSALHDRGVIHAGLDPETVVYPRRSRGRTAPMLDGPGLLDVYRRYVDPATVVDPRYAAPELYETDRGIVDRATDVYGMGAVLFTLFTGRPPYDGDPEAVREAVLAEAVPLPSSVDPRVPGAVDDLVERAMAPDKFERFGTAADLADAVEAVCRDVLQE
jgi:hypothetical protein